MSMIIGRAITAGAGGGGGKLDFTYTGTYNERDDGVVEFLTSGILTFNSKATIDVFVVGGGGGGGGWSGATSKYNYTGGGGGGGYTTTVKGVEVVNDRYSIIVGSGGNRSNGTASTPSDGGASSFITRDNVTIASANGGDRGYYYASGSGKTYGGAGGSGGGYNGPGGSDGSNGYVSKGDIESVGVGQGTTTREFGESIGKLYSGGGGGGNTYDSTSYPGGSGGGGAGGPEGGRGYDATQNTGGGGGGAGGYASGYSGVGGSGIVCIRLSIKS